MNINTLLTSLGLSGLFSSRAFLPAFVTALALRFGHHFPKLQDIDFIKNAGEKVAAGQPDWFTNGYFIIALGVLSLVELLADKSPEARELMDEFSAYAKTAVSGLTTMGVLSAGDKAFAESLIEQQAAGFWDIFPALGSAALTYVGATVRGGFMAIISDSDPDDTVKIRGFLSWLEDFWGTFGVWYLITAPLVAFLVILAFFSGLHFIRKRHEGKLEEAKVPCAKCGQRIHSFATACHHCETQVESPNVIGFLGGIKEEKAESIEEQKLRLLRLKRSPKSGERFEGKGVELKCEEDGVEAFDDPRLTRAYIDSVNEKLPQALALGAVLGLVPVVGLVAGVIYYRLRLVAPFRRYLTFGRSFMTRWLIRIILILLALLQVSGGGIIAVPLMALLNFWFYRSAFKTALEKAGKEIAA